LAGRQHRPDLRPGGRIHQDAPSKSARSPTATPHRASRAWTRSRPANSREEIERGEADPDYRLKLGESKVILPEAKKKKGPRYTPVSRRHERPSAILWLVRSHPELKDSQIMRLVGTTKTTIASVRDRSHWNAAGLTPMDPVTLGLCSQIELDFEVQRAAKEKPATQQYGGATLLPASETTRKDAELEHSPASEKQRDDLEVDAVFAKLKTIGGKKPEDE
jgi:hypothetical protein